MSYRYVGLLINGVEFIPQEVVEKHLPFAAPPDVQIQALFVEVEEGAE